MGIKAKLHDFVFPFMGMTFLTVCFKYKEFFGTLYPINASIHLFGTDIQKFFLVMGFLSLWGIVALVFFRQFSALLYKHRCVIMLLACLGSLGSVASFVAATPAYSLVAMFFVSLGFFVSYLAWALFFSLNFNVRNLLLLTLSFLASSLLTYFVSFFEGGTDALIAITLAGAGLSWFFSYEPGEPPKIG
ncbi:MAG: hypothetical protein FWE65_03655, partial [Eggerthellaceae bacterium]|nr:hypothetical protein [Eggerthellaceae bacterium]